jgi:hypothetical protein
MSTTLMTTITIVTGQILPMVIMKITHAAIVLFVVVNGAKTTSKAISTNAVVATVLY